MEGLTEGRGAMEMISLRGCLSMLRKLPNGRCRSWWLSFLLHLIGNPVFVTNKHVPIIKLHLPIPTFILQ